MNCTIIQNLSGNVSWRRGIYVAWFWILITKESEHVLKNKVLPDPVKKTFWATSGQSTRMPGRNVDKRQVTIPYHIISHLLKTCNADPQSIHKLCPKLIAKLGDCESSSAGNLPAPATLSSKNHHPFNPVTCVNPSSPAA